MFGLILVSLGTFFEEISDSIGKKEVRDKKETVYTMAFLSLLWGFLWFGGILLYKQAFGFSFESIPTFSIRLVLEIIQIHTAVLAVVLAERSTFGFVRTGTLPLLLMVDLFLGYSVAIPQIVGIVLVICSLLVLSLNHGIKKPGLGYVIYSTIGAVGTISLYKYNITYYNSVEAEQFLIHLFLLIYFYFVALRVGGENPLRILRQKIFFTQSFAAGVGSVVMSFAYLFAAASVITSAKRSLSVFWSILSGGMYFHEKHIAVKLVSFALLVAGVVLLAV
jgi:hypothetical protein